ncbi:hypothetical protein I316_00331 [Kwoniella heveanensis BCC8398]|uniref:Uncharacterized protein n=1 Tax=Kwoniella heveanensis BCC8398 TaxID=1296120 RepID=A0A1B9H4B2_9TREE|nr:hypothetical protein I316_00331 [Kwoniella heveanensis BCC8398]
MSSYGNSSSGNTVTAYEMTEQSSYAADASLSAPAATNTGASTNYSTGAEEQTSWASSVASFIGDNAILVAGCTGALSRPKVQSAGNLSWIRSDTPTTSSLPEDW